MKKKFPTSVTILGRKYKIKLVTVASMENICGEPAEACVDINNFVIYIQKNLSDLEKYIGLFHEIQHISHFTCGIAQVVEPKIQEIICESTAQAFSDLLRSIHGK